MRIRKQSIEKNSPILKIVIQTKVYLKEKCLDLLRQNAKSNLFFQSVRWESYKGRIRFGLTKESERAERTGFATTPQSCAVSQN